MILDLLKNFRSTSRRHSLQPDLFGLGIQVALRFASPSSPLVYLKICRITIEVSTIAQANFVFSYQNKIKRACNNRLA